MRYIVLLLLCLFSWTVPSHAIVVLSEQDWQELKKVARGVGPTFPVSPALNDRFLLTSDDVSGNCTAGGGSAVTYCRWDGSSWVALSNEFVEADTLASVVTRGRVVSDANGIENAVQIAAICIYEDSTLGQVIKPCTDSNTRTYIWTNKDWCVFDVEGNACMWTFDPDAATPNAIYSVASPYRMRKSIWFDASALTTDGTQCAAAAEVTLNSGPKTATIICTDNDAATMYGKVKMPDSWDGGTLTFTHVYLQTAADTNALNGDITAQCRGNGATVDSTWGTEVAIDDAAVTGSNKNDMTTSGDVTPNGTCAGGAMLYWRYQIDAAGTTTAVATLHHLGFLMEYTVASLSD